MANKNKLLGLIVSNGYSQSTFAPVVKMCKNTLCAKLNGRSSFTVEEADRICAALNITDPAEKCKIFLNESSH